MQFIWNKKYLRNKSIDKFYRQQNSQQLDKTGH